MEENEKSELFSMEEAADYANVTRQAIWVAIDKGDLLAMKIPHKDKRGFVRTSWVIYKKDVDAYRASKYNREKRKIDGERIFDIENDRWSVLHASAVLRISKHRIYYLIRTGQIPAFKKGGTFILKKEDLLKIDLLREKGDPLQLEFKIGVS